VLIRKQGRKYLRLKRNLKMIWTCISSQLLGTVSWLTCWVWAIDILRTYWLIDLVIFSTVILDLCLARIQKEKTLLVQISRFVRKWSHVWVTDMKNLSRYVSKHFFTYERTNRSLWICSTWWFILESKIFSSKSQIRY